MQRLCEGEMGCGRCATWAVGGCGSLEVKRAVLAWAKDMGRGKEHGTFGLVLQIAKRVKKQGRGLGA